MQTEEEYVSLDLKSSVPSGFHDKSCPTGSSALSTSGVFKTVHLSGVTPTKQQSNADQQLKRSSQPRTHIGSNNSPYKLPNL